MTNISSEQVQYIQSLRQIELLVSSARQEMVDNLRALGPSSARELASVAGVPADTLYYHLNKLLEAGLVVERGKRPTSRRKESLYGLPAAVLKLTYDVPPAALKLIRKVIASALRTATRDFDAALGSKEAVFEGPNRNLWATRAKGWLSDTDLATLNGLLDRIESLLEASGPGDGRQLCSFTWALSPVRPMAPRRERT